MKRIARLATTWLQAVLYSSTSGPVADLCGLVSQQRVLGCILAVAASLKLCQVTVVVTLHLQVKYFGLARGGSGDKVIVQQLEDAGADVAQLLLYLQQDGHSAHQKQF